MFLSFTKWTWQCILACYNFTVGFLPPNKRAHLIWTQMMSSAFPVRALSLGCLRFLWLICMKHYALGKIVEGTPVLLFLLEHCWHCNSEVCQEPTSWSKKHTVTVKKKNPILFIEIPWDVIIRVVSTFCFPLPYSLPTPQYQLKVRRGCGEATAPPCCWSPEEGVKRHKWPQYELLAQSFPSGSHVNVYVCTVESETKLQLEDGKSVLFLNTH